VRADPGRAGVIVALTSLGRQAEQPREIRSSAPL
jgi:hypothetical protein